MKLLRGGVRFPTGGNSPQAARPNRCNSGTDGTVRTGEVQTEYKYVRIPSSRGWDRFFETEVSFLKNSVNRLVKLGMLAALSLVLVYFIRFPIFPAAPYLEYDMADVPILIGTFLFGPWWGLALTAVVSTLQALLVSSASGWVGAVMHFCATGANVLLAGLIYRRIHSLKGAILALSAGIVIQTLMMVPLNLIFTVHFNGAPAEMVRSMMLPVIVPFNLIKSGVNALLTFLLYKSLGKLLRLF